LSFGTCSVAVEALLNSEDAIIVLLDYNQLATQSEEIMMAKLKASIPQLMQRLAQRIFFVVNKCDNMYSTQVHISCPKTKFT
jgi:predicted GTPase